MPVGSFASYSLTPEQRGAGSGSMTGTGAPSQPRGTDGPSYAGGWRGTSTPNPASSPSPASNQFPQGQGPIPGGGSLGAPTLWNQQQQANTGMGSSLINAQMLATTMYGPQQQALMDQLARQQAQLGMVGINADYQAGALQRDTDLARQSLGLDRQGLGIDRNLTNTQLANLDRLRGILRQQYGLAGDVLANQLTGFQVDEDKARDMAGRNIWDLRSDLTSRGAFNTIANERGTGRINRDLDYSLRQIDVGRQGARLSNKGTILGLDEKGIGYDNTEAGLRARLANLNLDYQRVGIKEKQLANALQDGLDQIGLSAYGSIGQFIEAAGGGYGQQSQMAGTILQMIGQLAGLPPGTIDYIIRQATATGGGSRSPESRGIR